MGVRTRIGIAALTTEKMGSIELPEEVTLYCPQCGTLCSDKGQCLLELAEMPDEERKMAVKLIVDCRNCDCYGKAPSTRPKE